MAATLLATLAPSLCPGQGTRADYDRANNLRRLIENKVFKQRVKANWLPGNTRFWYRNDLADGAREYLLVDAAKGERKPAFDHARLAAALAKATGKEVKADRLAVDKMEPGPDDSRWLLAVDGKWWLANLSTYELSATNREEQVASSVRTLDRPRPSRRTGEETSVTFVNQTRNDAVTWWIDEQGERHRYATVRAGDQFQQHTFAGHVWLATDAQGKTLGRVRGHGGGKPGRDRREPPGEDARPRTRENQNGPASRARVPRRPMGRLFQGTQPVGARHQDRRGSPVEPGREA